MYFRKRSIILLPFFALRVFAAEPSVPGIHNFYKVDEHVYRGGQPTLEGFQYLAKIGVKTILDLRENDARTPEEKRMVVGSGMQYVNVPMTGLTPPTDTEITKVLALLEDSASGPVFVHCQRGADRTGAVIGAYRIDFHHWDGGRALKEAVANGMSMFQMPRKNFIRTFQPRTLEAKAPEAKAPARPAEAAVLESKAATSASVAP